MCILHVCVPGRHKLQHHYLLALYDKGDELSAEITPRTRSQLICNLTFTFLGQLGQREEGRRGTRIQQVLQGEVGHLTYASHSHTRLSHSVTTHSASQRLTCCMWQQTVATLFACSLYSFCARNNCIKFTKHATQSRGSKRVRVNAKTQQSPTMLSKMRTNSSTLHICNAKLNVLWLINNNLTRLKSSKTI